MSLVNKLTDPEEAIERLEPKDPCSQRRHSPKNNVSYEHGRKYSCVSQPVGGLGEYKRWNNGPLIINYKGWRSWVSGTSLFDLR